MTLWPTECSRSDVMGLPRLGLEGPCSSHLGPSWNAALRPPWEEADLTDRRIKAARNHAEEPQLRVGTACQASEVVLDLPAWSTLQLVNTALGKSPATHEIVILTDVLGGLAAITKYHRRGGCVAYMTNINFSSGCQHGRFW